MIYTDLYDVWFKLVDKPTKSDNISGTLLMNTGVNAIWNHPFRSHSTWLLGILCEAGDATCSRPPWRSWAREVAADPWLEPDLFYFRNQKKYLGNQLYTYWNIWHDVSIIYVFSYLYLWTLINQHCVSFHIGLPPMMLFCRAPVPTHYGPAWYENKILVQTFSMTYLTRFMGRKNPRIPFGILLGTARLW